MASATNLALMRLNRRAEAGANEQMLVSTFVDVGPPFTMMSSDDHQILYGRRGTGKTHALTYFRAHAEEQGDVAALVDLRTIGSTGGLYSDSTVPITERGTRLLVDVLAQLHDGLVDHALERAEHEDMTAALTLLDRLADAITRIEVVGQQETETVEAEEEANRAGGRLSASLSPAGPGFSAGADASRTASARRQVTTRMAGTAQHRVHFGEVSQVLQRLASALSARRVWILLDEWTAVPLDLQPLLADLLRRAIFPVRGVVVKIAAIEQRTNFSIDFGDGDYLGIEVGANAPADLDLDDYMVFGNDPDAAKTFFQELLFRHIRAQMEEDGQQPPSSAGEFQRVAFTQRL